MTKNKKIVHPDLEGHPLLINETDTSVSTGRENVTEELRKIIYFEQLQVYGIIPQLVNICSYDIEQLKDIFLTAKIGIQLSLGERKIINKLQRETERYITDNPSLKKFYPNITKFYELSDKYEDKIEDDSPSESLSNEKEVNYNPDIEKKVDEVPNNEAKVDPNKRFNLRHSLFFFSINFLIIIIFTLPFILGISVLTFFNNSFHVSVYFLILIFLPLLFIACVGGGTYYYSKIKDKYKNKHQTASVLKYLIDVLKSIFHKVKGKFDNQRSRKIAKGLVNLCIITTFLVFYFTQLHYLYEFIPLTIFLPIVILPLIITCSECLIIKHAKKKWISRISLTIWSILGLIMIIRFFLPIFIFCLIVFPFVILVLRYPKTFISLCGFVIIALPLFFLILNNILVIFFIVLVPSITVLLFIGLIMCYYRLCQIIQMHKIIKTFEFRRSKKIFEKCRNLFTGTVQNIREQFEKLNKKLEDPSSWILSFISSLISGIKKCANKLKSFFIIRI